MNESELFGRIPRSREEMQEIEDIVARKDTKKILEKAYSSNARIENAKKMALMFGTDEFRAFWKAVNEDMEVIDVGIRNIRGNPAKGGYDPLGQLVQLNNVQGALEMLEAQNMQVEVIRKLAESETIDTEVLQAKIREMEGAN